MSHLLAIIRESGGDFGMAVGRGNDEDDDVIVDVQIAATGRCAVALVALVSEWHEALLAAPEGNQP